MIYSVIVQLFLSLHEKWHTISLQKLIKLQLEHHLSFPGRLIEEVVFILTSWHCTLNMSNNVLLETIKFSSFAARVMNITNLSSQNPVHFHFYTTKLKRNMYTFSFLQIFFFFEPSRYLCFLSFYSIHLGRTFCDRMLLENVIVTSKGVCSFHSVLSSSACSP